MIANETIHLFSIFIMIPYKIRGKSKKSNNYQA
jgi:hypothetical protein